MLRGTAHSNVEGPTKEHSLISYQYNLLYCGYDCKAPSEPAGKVTHRNTLHLGHISTPACVESTQSLVEHESE